MTKLKYIVSIVVSILIVLCFSLFTNLLRLTADDNNNEDVVSSVDQNNEFKITFFDMGDGDCIFVEYNDLDVLIDVGDQTKGLDRIKETLKENISDGVLEYMIITHGHVDHLKNYETVFSWFNPTNFDNNLVTNSGKKFYIDTLIDFDTNASSGTSKTETYNHYVKDRDNMIDKTADKTGNKGIKNYFPIDIFWENNFNTDTQTALIIEGELKIHFLENENYFQTPPNADPNDFSIITMFEYGKSKCLLTGDAEQAEEDYLIEKYKFNPAFLDNITVFKAGHHGSKHSNTKNFLELISPKYVMITCIAGGTKYNFPSQEALDNFFTYTSHIYVSSYNIDTLKDSSTDDNDVKSEQKSESSSGSASYYGDVTFILDNNANVNVKCEISKPNPVENSSVDEFGITPIYETKWFVKNRKCNVQTYLFSGYGSSSQSFLGSCILLKFGSIDILFDCGHYSTIAGAPLSSSNFSDKVRKYCVDEVLDYVFITSPTVNCTSQLLGENGILSTMKVSNLIDFGNSYDPSDEANESLFKDYIEYRSDFILNNCNNYFTAKKLQNTDGINITNDLTIQILKNDYYESKDSKNKFNSSLSCIINYKGNKTLFLGNVGENGLKSIKENNDLSEIDFLIVNNYANSNSLNDSFLASISEINNENLYIGINGIAGIEAFSRSLCSKEMCDLLLKYTKNVYVSLYHSNEGYKEICGDIVFVMSSDLSYNVQNAIDNIANNHTKLMQTEYYNNLK